MEKLITWTKEQLKDSAGRPMTQSLFLEIGYTDYSIFTLNDEDKVYKDRVYPSLKKWFLECEDPTEYMFAKKCLLGWKHWQRLNENGQLKPHFQEWREELEVLMRSKAIQGILDLGQSDNGNFNAARWIADRGWEKRGAGRPPKHERERQENIEQRIANELKSSVDRMKEYDA